MKKILLFLTFVFAFSGLIFSQVIDQDCDGLDDVTGQVLAEPISSCNPMADGPIWTISLGALGIEGVNSSTWECDGVTPAANGATGFLWVGDSWNDRVYKIDTLVPAILISHQLTVSPDGLGWDGRNLLVHDSGGTVYLVDPISGAVVGNVPSVCGWPHGISWKADLSPASDQYMWEPDFNGGFVNQVIYFTNTTVFSFPDGGSVIGSLTDGYRTWTSDFGISSYLQYDIATGANLAALNVGAVNSNPRDGTWDGHYLWDITWQNGSWAWQWDLYNEIGMYEVTVCPNSKYQKVRPCDFVRIYIAFKNHTAAGQRVNAQLDIFNCSGNLVYKKGPVSLSLAAGQIFNYVFSLHVPSAAPGIYKVRLRVTDAQGNVIHEDWCIIDLDP